MATLLISDLHLDAARPGMLDAFERLLEGPARTADSLYILGDLFEAWVGDDDDGDVGARVARAIAGIADAGVPVAFQHGNRDFLLGTGYATRCGMRLLPEAAVEVVGGVPTLLLHGDSLCLADTAYLAFRAQVRAPAWQQQFLSQPLAQRRAFAAAARSESERHTRGAAPVLMDVAPAAVEQALRQHGIWRMVHGHTHRPALHAFDVGGTTAVRCVLPDWYDTAGGIWVDGESIRFQTFP